ncbi:hypothetical protein Moror_12339 [Moniliophthora roreri MCA 2997]|uniref:Uncharacterized protein n=1 Tax=Moniliophthora roreri (strain MCA 2997) TaxID=1381753 RepID=V2XSL5_MONRO|nr:hypothetical protein Moror_12339 [Moniliophthora roreri MCA 2997]KAI3615884.1 hypothetical protein WG66_010249 [Moniliophthora roreri]
MTTIVLSQPPTPTTTINSRKRTCSFSCSATPTAPKAKAPRMGMTSAPGLRRTESCVSLLDMQLQSQGRPSSSSRLHSTSNYSLREKEREHRKRALMSRTPQPQLVAPCKSSPHPPSLPAASSSYTAPSKPSLPSSQPSHQYRASSPLSPPSSYTPRPHSTLSTLPLPSPPVAKPRKSKRQEPDLYKQAIIARMRCTPEGQKILHMGPRLALSIMEATRDLEMLVARNGLTLGGDAMDVDKDSPSLLSNSWVQVSAGDDWEMVDCAA